MRSRSAVVLLLLAAAAVGVGFMFPVRPHADVAGLSSGRPTVTFHLRSIPFSAPEIGNPWRGQYNWQGIQLIPASYPWPTTDSYLRIPWRQLEPAEGQYNFGIIDRDLAAAKARGGKFGFRIEAVRQDVPIMVPDYLVSRMAHGYWSGGCSHCGVYVPDFNSQAFMSRAHALIAALSKRYANDSRLGWVETGFYGNYGEWIVDGLPDNPSTGQPPAMMSDANRKRLIDWVYQAFPLARIIQIVEEDGDQSGFKYAMRKSLRIGWRYDGLGGGDLNYWARYYGKIFTDRWKTAPGIAEFNGLLPPTVRDAYNKTIAYHIDMVDGGFVLGGLSAYSPVQQATLISLMKHSGYRISLDSLTMPARIRPSTRFTVKTTWSNVGVTPPYTPWNIVVQLRKASGSVVWQGQSSYTLQTLLPTNADRIVTPVSVKDIFSLPSRLRGGKYRVSVQVQDPAHYYEPLNLANYNRRPDGSYRVGTITVKP